MSAGTPAGIQRQACPACGTKFRLAAEDFPLICACGAEYDAIGDLAQPRPPRPLPPIAHSAADVLDLAAVPPEERAQLAEAVAAEGMLLGDWIAGVTRTLKIPHCAGCEAKRKWINSFHQAVRVQVRKWRGLLPPSSH